MELDFHWTKIASMLTEKHDNKTVYTVLSWSGDWLCTWEVLCSYLNPKTRYVD